MSNVQNNSGSGVNTQPNVQFVNLLMDGAVVLTCFVSAWLTAGGLQTVMESENQANAVALAIAVVSSAFWLALNHWYPYANKDTKKSMNFLIAAFCLLMLFGSTLFSVVTMGGRDAIALHEQTVLQDAREQGLKYLQQGSRELNLVPPLKTYSQIFRQLADRETFGDVSGLKGAGLVVASLRNTASAFESFAGSVQDTHSQRETSYKKLETAIGEGQDLVVKQQQVRGDYPKYQDLQVQFGSVVGSINKELAHVAGLSSMRFLQEANGNLENLTSIIGKGSEAQNEAITRLRQPVQAAQATLSKLIAENKAVGDMKPPTFTMIPMSYAIFVHAREISSMWALGVMMDFLPVFFLILKAKSYHHFLEVQQREAANALPQRLEEVKAEIARLRQVRNGQTPATQAFRATDQRIQELKAEQANLEKQIAQARS